MSTTLTNAALGEALGVTHATISRIRSGDRNPSTELMTKLSELIGWSIEEQIKLKQEQVRLVVGRSGNRPYADALREREGQIAEALAKRDG